MKLEINIDNDQIKVLVDCAAPIDAIALAFADLGIKAPEEIEAMRATSKELRRLHLVHYVWAALRNPGVV